MNWDKIHKEREWGVYPNEELVRFVCSLPRAYGKSALDIGCGAGANIGLLNDRGYDVHAIDVSWHAVKRARVRHPGASVLHTGFLEYKPDIKKGFDLIVDCYALQYIDEADWQAAISKAIGMLAPGGYFWSMCPLGGITSGDKDFLWTIDVVNCLTINKVKWSKKDGFSKEDLTIIACQKRAA